MSNQTYLLPISRGRLIQLRLAENSLIYICEKLFASRDQGLSPEGIRSLFDGANRIRRVDYDAIKTEFTEESIAFGPSGDESKSAKGIL